MGDMFINTPRKDQHIVQNGHDKGMNWLWKSPFSGELCGISQLDPTLNRHLFGFLYSYGPFSHKISSFNFDVDLRVLVCLGSI